MKNPITQRTMLQLKLKDPYEAVFLGLRLKNPSTGESTIVDAKIDTGATVTLGHIAIY